MCAFFSWDSFTGDGWQRYSERGEDDAQILRLLGPLCEVSLPFTAVIPSWSAETPVGGWIEVQVRVRRAGRWTGFYRIAQWDGAKCDSVRCSFDAQVDDDGCVATDTLLVSGSAEALQVQVLLVARGAVMPVLREVCVVCSGPGEPLRGTVAFPVCELAVPLRSQMVYPNGGHEWCSPTSVTMVLAYWYAQTGDVRLAGFVAREVVPEVVVPQVYDPVYDGHGNWAFNTAFAAVCGLRAYVTRLEGLGQLALWVGAGVPVVASVAWGRGELDGAAIPESRGHLLVVIGFDAVGGVIVADPAGGCEEEVRRVYDVRQFEAAWMRVSQGAVYLLYPHDWAVPLLRGAPWWGM